jgi:hypothetical protein
MSPTCTGRARYSGFWDLQEGVPVFPFTSEPGPQGGSAAPESGSISRALNHAGLRWSLSIYSPVTRAWIRMARTATRIRTNGFLKKRRCGATGRSAEGKVLREPHSIFRGRARTCTLDMTCGVHDRPQGAATSPGSPPFSRIIMSTFCFATSEVMCALVL